MSFLGSRASCQAPVLTGPEGLGPGPAGGWGARSQGLRYLGHGRAVGCGLPGRSAWLPGEDTKSEKGALSRPPTQPTLRTCPSLPRVGGPARAAPADSLHSGSWQGCLRGGSGQRLEGRLTSGPLVQGRGHEKRGSRCHSPDWVGPQEGKVHASMTGRRGGLGAWG